MSRTHQLYMKAGFVFALVVWISPTAQGWGQEPTPQPQPRVEVSLRSWLFTTGEAQWSHDASGLNPILGDPTSKLKYKDSDTHLVGLGAKVYLSRRLYLDGEFGLSVDFDRGSLIDDDYLAGQRLFSRTSSAITGKGTWYVSGNVGYRAAQFKNNRGYLDVLVGAQYWRTTYEATGVNLIVCDPLVVLNCNSSVDPAIKNTIHWGTPIQVGGQLQYQIVPHVIANLKVLFSPASLVVNEDIHFQRPDLQHDPSFSMFGVGLGASAEPSLSVLLTPYLKLTGGYRIMWNRTYYGRLESHPIGSSSDTVPLTEFQTIRHGVTVTLTAAF